MKGLAVERLIATTDLGSEPALRYLQQRLRQLGVTPALEEAGAAAGVGADAARAPPHGRLYRRRARAAAGVVGATPAAPRPRLRTPRPRPQTSTSGPIRWPTAAVRASFWGVCDGGPIWEGEFVWQFRLFSRVARPRFPLTPSPSPTSGIWGDRKLSAPMP
ncbi:MAG: DUF1967 domain-containing protein [Chloroflexi bacterium]|nr:DUF1967 domain-containing protein [Chloroflexota bacterium]